MQVCKGFLLVVAALMAQQSNAGTISLGGLMGDISQVAVAGEKIWHKLETAKPAEPRSYKHLEQHEAYNVEPATYNVLSDMANALGDLANTITSLRVQEPETQNILSDMANGLGELANIITGLSTEEAYVKPEPFNLIGDALGGMGSALGDLANTITHLNVVLKHQPQTRSIASDGASIIGEEGAISAKAIAAAAQAAAPYVSKMNQALGDLANTITNLNVRPKAPVFTSVDASIIAQ